MLETKGPDQIKADGFHDTGGANDGQLISTMIAIYGDLWWLMVINLDDLKMMGKKPSSIIIPWMFDHLNWSMQWYVFHVFTSSSDATIPRIIQSLTKALGSWALNQWGSHQKQVAAVIIGCFPMFAKKKVPISMISVSLSTHELRVGYNSCIVCIPSSSTIKHGLEHFLFTSMIFP